MLLYWISVFVSRFGSMSLGGEIALVSVLIDSLVSFSNRFDVRICGSYFFSVWICVLDLK